MPPKTKMYWKRVPCYNHLNLTGEPNQHATQSDRPGNTELPQLTWKNAKTGQVLLNPNKKRKRWAEHVFPEKAENVIN